MKLRERSPQQIVDELKAQLEVVSKAGKITEKMFSNLYVKD
jgi:predicted nucleic acid-binding protein